MENAKEIPAEPNRADLEISEDKKNVTPLKLHRQKPFPIVAIGGSAGSFQAYEKFFTHMPADSGIAFVIILHLDANHSGNVAELIQSFSPMPVQQAEDGILVQPNHVYIIPPNKDMGIHNRKLLLFVPTKGLGLRLPIDYFLQSLAEDQWNKAVAIIFSGMGSDGETGVRIIKEKLGMAMVQDPETAQFDSMPKASIGTNLADYVLSPEEMPIKLIQYLNHPALDEEPVEQIKSEIRDTNSIQKILMVLRGHTGHDFSHYKKSTITRRIDRRIAYHQLPDYSHYINFLRENPSEIDVLFTELLIGVTKFFRDSQAFESLKEKLYPILHYKTDTEPVRVWVTACSTGEEAYSIAMILMECFHTIKVKRLPRIQIFATDLDMEAIKIARTGLYKSNIVADVSPERIEQFFSKKGDSYQVKKELREMIVFAHHNIIKDAPFTRLDLLTCRNVMIYLNTDLQKKIIPIFHYSLNPQRILMLGPAETIGGFTDMFAPVDPKWKIFERRENPSNSVKTIDFPFNVAKQTSTNPKEETVTVKKKTLADSFNKFLLDTYTPVSLLVNEKGDILYINGKTGKFLELNSGEAATNVYEMVKEGLKYVLRNAIHQARIQKNTITVNDIKIKEDNHTRLVNIKVSQMNDATFDGLTLIILEDKGMVKTASALKTKKTAKPETNALANELEKELEYTKQQLHSTIEQMETSLEELKSTNEELQSTNEELQSTNEESLTTKEEMQSLNEELMTINTSFQFKTEELTRLNNDMKNLLDSTEISTVFLDNRLMILRFTPTAKALFNVIASDIGRSITDIVFNFDLPDFKAHILQVIETLVSKEVEIRTRKGEWYNLRIMPYRTLDNFINGVVLTFTNITSLKVLQKKVGTMIEYAQSLVNIMSSPALLLNQKQEIITVNQAFKNFFLLEEQHLKGVPFPVVLHEFWKTTKLDKPVKNLPQEKAVMELEHDFPAIGKKHLTITSMPSVNKDTAETLLVMIVIEEKARR
ncbi:CheR family methyltransferase [Mucilaginibacter arboris]|uniref:protein-glutamate O-methyltransferase n=1 Tax=Mucilaginibacter arboris TaxID=2682090 RepID=A0A7K1SZF0_9SPHI|nr:CheR family methyltransferase [Mucilaginibacter arboris]MVN22420.1 PAS domain-containing protein [Mucilaginibacter arboris]